MLSETARLIDRGVEAVEKLLDELAKHRQVVDDVPVALLKKEHGRQLAITSAYADQIERWKKQPHSMDEHFQLMRLGAQCERLKTLLTEVLA